MDINQHVPSVLHSEKRPGNVFEEESQIMLYWICIFMFANYLGGLLVEHSLASRLQPVDNAFVPYLLYGDDSVTQDILHYCCRYDFVSQCSTSYLPTEEGRSTELARCSASSSAFQRVGQQSSRELEKPLGSIHLTRFINIVQW
jgi:hypothetical protein